MGSELFTDSTGLNAVVLISPAARLVGDLQASGRPISNALNIRNYRQACGRPPVRKKSCNPKQNSGPVRNPAWVTADSLRHCITPAMWFAGIAMKYMSGCCSVPHTDSVEQISQPRKSSKMKWKIWAAEECRSHFPSSFMTPIPVLSSYRRSKH